MMGKWFIFLLVMLAPGLAGACIPFYPQYPTDGKDIVEVKMGDTYFRFPESFFYYAEDRLPIARDYVRIRVSGDDFTALPLREDIAQMQFGRGQPQESMIAINIRENDAHVRGYSNATPSYPLTSGTEMEYWNTNVTLTPEGIREKLKPFMFSVPSPEWEANQRLARELHIKKEHSHFDPCAAMNRRQRGEEEIKPAPLPLVEMKTIEQGLRHKSQAFRERALYELVRHKEHPGQVVARLKEIAGRDSEYYVRMMAIRYLQDYDPAGDNSAFLLERFLEDDNSEVIRTAADFLNYGKASGGVAAAIIPELPHAKGVRLQKMAEILAGTVNHEVQVKKLTDYAQLSVDSRRALDAVLDYLARDDVPANEKRDITNTLRNSKAAIASPRYVQAMIDMAAIAELGSMAPQSRAGLPFLIDELKSDRMANYSEVVEAIGKFGPEAKDVLPLMLPLLNFTCTEGNMSPRMPGETGYDPRKCLSFMEDYTRQVTANAIGEIGVATPETLNALYDALENTEDVRYNAAMALSRVEPDQDRLMKKLIELLTTLGDASGRGSVILALREMGPQAKAALPALEKAREEQVENRRGELDDAIEAISGKRPGEPVLHRLREAVLDNLYSPERNPEVKRPTRQPPQQMPEEVREEDRIPLIPGGAKDVSVASHDAYEKTFEGKTHRKSGEFAIYGAWDSGDCRGDDQWMCGEMSRHDTGCIREFDACESGKAIAVESYEGDRKCVFTWWKWVCK